ncbi:unnamed protein product [Rotaria magnacalcarata]
MKSRKAPGNDGITADLLKAGGLPVAIWLHEIFVDIWKQEEIVEDWALAILIRDITSGSSEQNLLARNTEPCSNLTRQQIAGAASRIQIEQVNNRPDIYSQIGNGKIT